VSAWGLQPHRLGRRRSENRASTAAQKAVLYYSLIAAVSELAIASSFVTASSKYKPAFHQHEFAVYITLFFLRIFG
jgi:hypothetical protein